MKRLRTPLAGRPEKARVTVVPTSRRAARADLYVADAPDSSVNSRYVPTRTAEAPAWSTALIASGVANPPAATTGSRVVVLIWATRLGRATGGEGTSGVRVP